MSMIIIGLVVWLVLGLFGDMLANYNTGRTGGNVPSVFQDLVWVVLGPITAWGAITGLIYIIGRTNRK